MTSPCAPASDCRWRLLRRPGDGTACGAGTGVPGGRASAPAGREGRQAHRPRAATSSNSASSTSRTAAALPSPRGFMLTFGDIKSGSGIRARASPTASCSITAPSSWPRSCYSIRNFKLGQLSFALPPAAGGRLRVSSRVRWQDAPSLAFYALGTPSPSSGPTTPRPRPRSAPPRRFGRSGCSASTGRLGFERFDTGPADADKPRIETFFTGVPGLNADPRLPAHVGRRPPSTRATATATRGAAALLQATPPRLPPAERRPVLVPARRRRRRAVPPDPARQLGPVLRAARLDDHDRLRPDRSRSS